MYTVHVWFIFEPNPMRPSCYRIYQVCGQEEFRPCRYDGQRRPFDHGTLTAQR